jgi:hypothetical protein
MQALKAVVIFLGVLIVIGMGVLAYGIMLKFGEWQARNESEAPPATVDMGSPTVSEPWAGNLKVSIPAGAKVVETIVGEGQLIARVSLPDGSQRYMIFDLSTGKQIGSIELQPVGSQ